jgi:hypothetical protein
MLKICANYKKAQSSFEYVILIGAVIGMLIAMQSYIKRAMQGRLKGESDALGDMYSPTTMTGSTTISSSRKSTEDVKETKTNIDQSGSSSKTESYNFRHLRDEF